MCPPPNFCHFLTTELCGSAPPQGGPTSFLLCSADDYGPQQDELAFQSWRGGRLCGCFPVPFLPEGLVTVGLDHCCHIIE